MERGQGGGSFSQDNLECSLWPCGLMVHAIRYTPFKRCDERHASTIGRFENLVKERCIPSLFDGCLTEVEAAASVNH